VRKVPTLPATHWPCLTAHAEGACLSISVLPNARRSELVGLHGGALRIRLAAPPIEGRANEALVAWLADELALPRRAVVLKSGLSGRLKRVVVHAEFATVKAWLERRLGPAEALPPMRGSR
jgi:uncharacterized protein (TIGR00251 family)